MSIDPLAVRARGLREHLARVPVSFASPGGVDVVVSPADRTVPGRLGRSGRSGRISDRDRAE